MKVKAGSWVYTVSLLLLLGRLTATAADLYEQLPTPEQLADICEQLESAILDISMEYEWLVDSTRTLEEKLEFIAEKNWSVVVGPRKCKMACSLTPSNPNEPNAPLFDRYVFEETDTTMREPNKSCDHLITRCYNGQVAKSLYVDSPPGAKQGFIFQPDHTPRPWIPHPVQYFSIHRFRAIWKMPLSEVLRKANIRLNSTVSQINGFNTITADFIEPTTNKPFRRIYFSVEHGYMPVRYEDLHVSSGIASSSVRVNSLEKVGEGLWFPSSGAMVDHDSEYQEANLYRATSKILVNQGLTGKDFDIDFPVGTKVDDKIKGIKYVVQPD